MVFCVWLPSFTIEFLRSINIAASVSTSFIFIANKTLWYAYMKIFCSLFAPLTIINNTKMNVCTNFYVDLYVQLSWLYI